MTELIKRLRDYTFQGDSWVLQQEAATAIEALQARVTELTAESETFSKSYGLLVEENNNLRTVMMAAAVEITEHWDAHCDSEGYGPANLVRRLENGYPAQYGYDAQTVVRMETERYAAEKSASDFHDKYHFTVSERDAALARVTELESDLAERTKLHHGCIDDLKEALAKLEALEKQEPVAWTFTEELTKRETTRRAHLWFTNPVNCMWSPLYASPVPAKTLSDSTIADVKDLVGLAMNKAWQLGQTYWQQADSDFESQHKKSDATQAAFNKRKEEFRTTIEQALKGGA